MDYVIEEIHVTKKFDISKLNVGMPVRIIGGFEYKGDKDIWKMVGQSGEIVDVGEMMVGVFFTSKEGKQLTVYFQPEESHLFEIL